MMGSKTYKPEGDFTSTEFWKVGNGIYMLKTENTNLKRLLSRRKSAELSSFCYDPKWKVFKLKYSSLKTAKDAFEYFTGITPVYDEARCVYRIPQREEEC